MGLRLAAGITMVGASSVGWNEGALAAEAVSNPSRTSGGGGGAHARCTPAMYPDDHASFQHHVKLWLHLGLLQHHLNKLQLWPGRFQHHQGQSSLLSVDEDDGFIKPTPRSMVT